nr:S24 family peptidase [uncultured Cohaesibacter sp.]
MNQTLADRIEIRLEELGLTVTAAAKRVGKGRDLIRPLLMIRNRVPRADNLGLIAQALETSPEWLLEGKGPKEVREIGSTVEFDPRPFATEQALVPEVGEVAAGVWLEYNHHHNEPGERLGPFPIDPRYPAAAQFSVRVRGTSINRVVPDGGSLHCVALFESGLSEQDLTNGQLVIVKRTRMQGGLFETTAKRLRKNGSWELWPDSTDPNWQEPIKVEDLHDNEDETVEVMAFVIGAHLVP